MTALVFHNTAFVPVQRENQIWLSAPQLAEALGYADQSSVNRIYARHSDEFTSQMTGLVNLTDPYGVKQETRIFSLRGAYLVAMFSRTSIAKEFRRWVLDILDKEIGTTTQMDSRTVTVDPNLIDASQLDELALAIRDAASPLKYLSHLSLSVRIYIAMKYGQSRSLDRLPRSTYCAAMQEIRELKRDFRGQANSLENLERRYVRHRLGKMLSADVPEAASLSNAH